MLEEMIYSQEELPIDEIPSPLEAELLEFCESELFPETLQNSEVASSSNCCYEEHSSYPTHLSIAAGINNYVENEMKPAAITSVGPSTPTAAAARNCTLSIIFDPADEQIENDISASIDFTPSPSFSIPPHQFVQNQEPFGISPANNLGTHLVDGSAKQYELRQAVPPPPPVQMIGPPVQTGYEEECCVQMGSVPPAYFRLRTTSPACALIDPAIAPYLPAGSMMSGPFSGESSGIFSGSGLMLGTDVSRQELEFQGDNAAFFFPDSIPRFFNCSSELQALSSESQHLVHGGKSNTNLTSEISSFEDTSFKVGKLTIEERRRKIHRYIKKRNERNFSKKIKYACRKTLADSRPRVRGRFAKNDEPGENGRTNTGSNQEDDTDEDVSLCSNQRPDHRNKVKEEEEQKSNIFTDINSLKCNYPIQSWI